MLVSSRMASLHELQTVYGVKDAYDLLEIVLVNQHNERMVMQWQTRQSKNW